MRTWFPAKASVVARFTSTAWVCPSNRTSSSARSAAQVEMKPLALSLLLIKSRVVVAETGSVDPELIAAETMVVLFPLRSPQMFHV